VPVHSGFLVEQVFDDEPRWLALAQPHERPRHGPVVGPDVGLRIWASETRAGGRGDDPVLFQVCRTHQR
jgi:hypothetical protein